MTATTPLAPGIPPALGSRPALSDSMVVALATLVWIGAAVARPLPLVAGLVAVVAAPVLRRPWLVLAAGLLLGSTFGARAVAGYQPVASSDFTGTVTLLSDPVDGFGSTKVDVRADGHRVELRATESGRGALASRLAGERVAVQGRIRPPPPDSPWLVPRHVVGRLDVTSVEPAGPGSAPWRAANVLRRTLSRGAASMSPERRSLFTGFVLGDDRGQPATLTDDFRGSGLTHLLAVSGENVAFVLTLVGPLLRRLNLGPRWALTLAVIGFFMLVTRFEPSVIRAGAMAGLAATAFLVGRPASGIRLLGLAVSGLVLIDPFLIHSVGFQLSVAASAGILLVGPALRQVVRGPRVIVEPLAVTAGAQLAVAPLLITTFGGLPVASVPANLLAGPAAGLVMTWGLGAGIPAGLIGGGVASLLHIPTSLGIGWIATVARAGAAAPLGELHIGHLLVLGVALVALIAMPRLDPTHRWRRGIPGVVLAGALLAPAIGLRTPSAVTLPVPGGELWRSGGGTVLVVGAVARVDDLLEELRRVGVRRLDLVVAQGSAKSAGRTVEALAHRWPPGRIWVARDVVMAHGETPAVDASLAIGRVVVTVEQIAPSLSVSVGIAEG